MKIFLRLLRKIRLRRKLSVASNKQSEMSPQLSAVSYQSSALNGWQLVKYCALDRARSFRIFLQSILVFVSWSAALGQDVDVHSTPAAQAETEITPLKIGDQIPDELWEMYFPVVSANSDQVQYLSLGDFKDKLIILDFWATWCAPCITSLNKLDTLQVQFKDDLMVIPTSYEPESKVKPFLISKTINLSSLIEETELKKYFPYRSIPHQVWIRNEEVLAIVGPEYANFENISEIISGGELDMLMITETIKFDSNEPLLIEGNGGNKNNLLYQSIFSKRIPMRISGFTRRDNHLLGYNVSVEQLFYKAYSNEIGSSKNKIIWELDESVLNLIKGNGLKRTGVFSLDQKVEEWLNEYTFCYSLSLPRDVRYIEQQKIMQKDLNNFLGQHLGIVGIMENRPIDCIVIKKNTARKNERKKSYQPDENIDDNYTSYSLVQVINMIKDIAPQYEVINSSQYDLTSQILVLNDSLNDLEQINKAIEHNNILLSKEIKQINALVVKTWK